MKILFLTHELPVPLDNGDRIYSFGILKELLRCGHDVHIVVFDKDGKSDLHDNVIKNFTLLLRDFGVFRVPSFNFVPFRSKTPGRAFFSLRPGMVANRWSDKYVEIASSELVGGEFQVVLVNHFKMAYLVERLSIFATQVPFVFISHNAEALLSKSVFQYHKGLFQKIPYWLDWKKMQKYEPRYLKQFSGVTAISTIDKDYFAKSYGLTKLLTFPPGVNPEDLPSADYYPSNKRVAIICGSFMWAPKRLNLEYLLDSPKFKLFGKNLIDLLIVGNADPALVAMVNNRFPNVKMTGPVESVKNYYLDSSVALIPEKMGGGFKLKILEAAVMQKAMVGLKGAIAAPGFEPGVHFLEADDFDEMIELTIELINNPERCQELASNAFDLLKRDYFWEHLSGKFNSFLEEIVRDFKPRQL